MRKTIKLAMALLLLSCQETVMCPCEEIRGYNIRVCGEEDRTYWESAAPIEHIREASMTDGCNDNLK
ncbi:hypothetical protein [Spongiimicrobium salis]|uniref:hypothetical protein n=1 Tax=Spongiimicrobium salis TaxID=1667022 RepID=UPI00374D9E6E